MTILSEENNIIALVQVRSNSTRLKKKQFLPLGDLKIIEWVVLRLEKLSNHVEVVYCIPVGSDDDELELLLRAKNLNVFRGSENDVLTRLYEGAESLGQDYVGVVRICADNPLVSSERILQLISFVSNQNLEFSFNHAPVLNSHHLDGLGAEYISKELFQLMFESARGEQREHITKYFYDHEDLFRWKTCPLGPFDSIAFDVKLDIDTYEDYIFLSNFIRLGKIDPRSTDQEILMAYSDLKNYLNHQKKLLEGLLDDISPNIFDRHLEGLLFKDRSLISNGTRETLEYLKEQLPGSSLKSYASGTKVFDWTIPKEWSLKSAIVKTTSGEVLIDVSDDILQIVNYSCSVEGVFKTEDVLSHFHYSDLLPKSIPYRTSYYKETWGFCCSKELYDKISSEEEIYIKIESEFIDSNLEVLEFNIPGVSKDEILISCYTCHPNMANDSLSGVILNLELAKSLSKIKPHLSYRFLFLPETIGPIAYMSDNDLGNVKYSLISTTCGLTLEGYQVKLPYNTDSSLFHAVKTLIFEEPVKFFPFDIHGSDERQFSSPGVRIPTTSIHRGKYYEYPQYHTSFDNREIVDGSGIYKSYRLTSQLLSMLEKSVMYRTGIRKGEPFLSSKGLYNSIGGSLNPNRSKDLTDAILWIYWFGEEFTTLECIAHKANLPLVDIIKAYEILLNRSLIEEYTS